MGLKDLKENDDVQEDKDSLGGMSFLLDSGVHPMKIEIAFVGESDGGATSLTLHLKNDESILRKTLWVTSGKAKGQKTYYENKDGKKINLPGFAAANSLAMLTLETPINELETEERQVKLYDAAEGKEVMKAVDAVVDLAGLDILVGVIRQTVDKQSKGDDGIYRPTGETREENEIDKFFCAKDGYEGLTLTEIKGGIEVSDDIFMNKWAAKWEGKTRDKSTKDAGGASAGAPAGSSAPKKSLFNKKG